MTDDGMALNPNLYGLADAHKFEHELDFELLLSRHEASVSKKGSFVFNMVLPPWLGVIFVPYIAGQLCMVVGSQQFCSRV